jgi:Recombinase
MSAEVRAAKADERAADVAPLIHELRDNGASLRQIAGELTARGILTPRGSPWTAMAVERSANVFRLIRRDLCF